MIFVIKVASLILFIKHCYPLFQFSSVQLLSCIPLFATPRTAASRASLSITNSQSLLKLRSIESMMSSNHLILCYPLLLLPSIFPSIRVFSSESVFHIRCQSIRASASDIFSFSNLILFPFICTFMERQL